MPNIADSLLCKQFVERLSLCEKRKDSFSSWERDFISNLRNMFDGREDAMDMGVTPWNPSVNQWNTLSEMAFRAEQW